MSSKLRLIQTLAAIVESQEKHCRMKDDLSYMEYPYFIHQLIARKNSLGDYPDLDKALTKIAEAYGRGDENAGMWADMEASGICHGYYQEEMIRVVGSRNLKDLLQVLKSQLDAFNEANLRDGYEVLPKEKFREYYLERYKLTKGEWRNF